MQGFPIPKQFMASLSRYKITVVLSLLFALIITAFFGAFVIVPFLLRHEPGAVGHSISAFASIAVYILSFRFLIRKYTRRKKILSRPFPQEWDDALKNNVVYYNALNGEEQERFRRQVQVFLGEKTITGIETDADLTTRILIAASAVIPVFRFPEWEYDKLGEILVYPSNFNDEFQFSGEQSDILGMVVTNSSALIISKPALHAGFRNSTDGYNVGIHEFIHKIDEEDGSVDGIPALLTDPATVSRWKKIIETESTRIEKGHSDINPYALTNEAEFFAVVSEYFFEKPSVMAQRHPDLYKILTGIFRQDTKALLKSAVRSILKPGGKKIGRNDPCPCGSGKKYKKCCLGKKQ